MEDEKKTVEIGYFMRKPRASGRPRMSDEAWAEKHPDGEKRRETALSQQKVWEANLAVLSPEKLEALELQAEKVRELLCYIDSVHVGLREHRIPGHPDMMNKGMCFPDTTLQFVLEFLEKHPACHSWCPDAAAKEMFAIEKERWDDMNYLLYGYRTLLWSPIVNAFYADVKEFLETRLDYEPDPGTLEIVSRLVYEATPEWQRRLDEDRAKEREKAEYYKAHPEISREKKQRDNTSIQQHDQEEAKRAADRLLSGLRDAEAEILRGEF